MPTHKSIMSNGWSSIRSTGTMPAAKPEPHSADWSRKIFWPTGGSIPSCARALLNTAREARHADEPAGVDRAGGGTRAARGLSPAQPGQAVVRFEPDALDRTDPHGPGRRSPAAQPPAPAVFPGTVDPAPAGAGGSGPANPFVAWHHSPNRHPRRFRLDVGGRPGWKERRRARLAATARPAAQGAVRSCPFHAGRNGAALAGTGSRTAAAARPSSAGLDYTRRFLRPRPSLAPRPIGKRPRQKDPLPRRHPPVDRANRRRVALDLVRPAVVQRRVHPCGAQRGALSGGAARQWSRRAFPRSRRPNPHGNHPA